MRVVLTIVALFVLGTPPAEARPRHHSYHSIHYVRVTHHAAHRVAWRHHARYWRRPAHEAYHAGNGGALDSKIAELSASCGARVISGYRPGARIAGTGRVSEHAYDHARDIVGNYSCIYAHLAGWPGGYSTDPGRVGHVHVSLGGPEDGRRFQHGGGGRRHHYAHRHRTRYARL